MRARRTTAAVMLAGAMTALTLHVAFAQPKKPKTPKTPKNPPAVVDAGGSAEAADEALGAADAAAPSTGAAQAAPVTMQGPQTTGDGGRLSPLNPTAQEMPGTTPALDAGTVDYDALIGQIAQLRARVAAVADSLFHSRLGVTIQADGSHGKIARLAVSIDDGVVYTSPNGFRGDDTTPVYGHAVAPGKHAVTVDVERRDDRNDAFRTQQRSRFVVEVVKDEQLDVEIQISDDSSMGGDFPSDKSGKYDLRVRVKATSHALKR